MLEKEAGTGVQAVGATRGPRKDTEAEGGGWGREAASVGKGV